MKNKAEQITQKAVELGFESIDLEIIYGTKDVEQTGFRIEKNFPGQEKELAELNRFILDLEYEKEIEKLQPKIQNIANQINL